MKKEIIAPYPDKNCFFCGSENNAGLKLKFYLDEEKDEIYTEYLPDKQFAGQGDILHGAIQMGLLDEIMGWACYAFTKQMAVTSDISIKFHRPTYICEEKINVKCKILSSEGHKVHMSATLSNNAGGKCTSATGTYHILSEEKYAKLIKNPSSGLSEARK